MNLRTTHVIGAALFACAIMVSGASASAQVVFRGTMQLANQTRWNQAVLEPGTYEVRVDRLAQDGKLIHLYGHGHQVSILAGPYNFTEATNTAKLEIVQVNGVDVVRRFDTGSLGLSFAFHVPKAARVEALQHNPSADIPVDATH